ncbi:hypothetical protein PCE1_004313 [Barthelona sp. PCE]
MLTRRAFNSSHIALKKQSGSIKVLTSPIRFKSQKFQLDSPQKPKRAAPLRPIRPVPSVPNHVMSQSIPLQTSEILDPNFRSPVATTVPSKPLTPEVNRLARYFVDSCEDKNYDDITPSFYQHFVTFTFATREIISNIGAYSTDKEVRAALFDIKHLIERLPNVNSSFFSPSSTQSGQREVNSPEPMTDAFALSEDESVLNDTKQDLDELMHTLDTIDEANSHDVSPMPSTVESDENEVTSFTVEERPPLSPTKPLITSENTVSSIELATSPEKVEQLSPLLSSPNLYPRTPSPRSIVEAFSLENTPNEPASAEKDSERLKDVVERINFESDEVVMELPQPINMYPTAEIEKLAVEEESYPNVGVETEAKLIKEEEVPVVLEISHAEVIGVLKNYCSDNPDYLENAPESEESEEEAEENVSEKVETLEGGEIVATDTNEAGVWQYTPNEPSTGFDSDESDDEVEVLLTEMVQSIAINEEFMSLNPYQSDNNEPSQLKETEEHFDMPILEEELVDDSVPIYNAPQTNMISIDTPLKGTDSAYLSAVLTDDIIVSPALPTDFVPQSTSYQLTSPDARLSQAALPSENYFPMQNECLPAVVPASLGLFPDIQFCDIHEF